MWITLYPILGDFAKEKAKRRKLAKKRKSEKIDAKTSKWVPMARKSAASVSRNRNENKSVNKCPISNFDFLATRSMIGGFAAIKC